jgi:hypothetical protein
MHPPTLDTETLMKTKPPQKSDNPQKAGCIKRLVGLVFDAVKSQEGHMIIELNLYPGDDDARISEMITHEIKMGFEPDQAVKEVVRRLFGRHEDAMMDACREDAHAAMRGAFEYLANS